MSRTSGRGGGRAPMIVVDIVCDRCQGAFVAEGEVAAELAEFPIIRRLYGDGDPRWPADEERAEFVAAASRHATDAGWLSRQDGRWLCPRHARRHGDGPLPYRLTAREVVRLHHILATGHFPRRR